MEENNITQEGVEGMIPPDGESAPRPAGTEPRPCGENRPGEGAGEGLRAIPDGAAQPADGGEAAVRSAFRAAAAEAEALRSRYPGFELGRALADRRFAAALVSLQRAGAPEPVRLAFEGVYHDRLTRDAVRAAVERTAAGLAESIRSAAARPAENGGGSAAGARVDPAALSPQQRRDIRDRVMRGERVTF